MNDTLKGGRFFVVKSKYDDARCLVEAHTISAALRRAAAHFCDAYPAKAAEIIEIMKQGCEVVEIAQGEDIELPLEEPSQTEIFDPEHVKEAMKESDIL